MTRGERKLIYILLIGIIVLASILIYKISSTPEYDQKLYEEIYSEYEEILLSSKNKETIENSNREQEDSSIYMLVNSQGQEFRVAGGIRIPKININYPIVYETTDEYLKIAPAKLFGPEINEVGNFCIVGHNYKNEQFFSRLSELEINDKVYLMTNKGESLTYSVYDKYEVAETDLSCTSQDTNGNIELTLITCTNKKSNRLIVKCRATI